MVSTQYDKTMFYENGERELFPPPTRNFVSVLECVIDLKQDKEQPALKGKMRVDVLFDRETKPDKVKSFKDGVEIKEGDKVKSYKEGVENIAKRVLKKDCYEMNVRYCRREGHQVGDIDNLFDVTGKAATVKQAEGSNKPATLLYFWSSENPPNF